MSKTGRWTVAALGIVLAGQVILSWGAGLLRAQSPRQETRPAYQYVGVQQTIARIDGATGRIELLSKTGEPRASLLTPDERAWEWREVPVREKRARPSSRSGPADETPGAERSDPSETETRVEGESAGS